MGNIVITTRCNRTCDYCFGGKHVARQDMDTIHAIKVLDIMLASGFRQVRLLGGEPTLHVHFKDILRAAVERGFETLIFSNGLMSSEALEAILDIPLEQCRVMINLNFNSPAKERTRVSEVAKILGERAFVGVNIYSPGMPLEDASDFVTSHGLQRMIRVGLAHPRLDRQNHYLHPRHYQRVGEELEHFLNVIHQDGFSLSFDCGFVPCMFTSGFFELAGITPRELGHRCNPIPDILPDQTAIHCFPLGELDELPISGIRTLQEMRTLHENRVGVFKNIGIFRECSRCVFLQNDTCTGGCLSAAMLRSNRTILSSLGQPKAPSVTMTSSPRTEKDEKPWVIPYIDQPVEFWEALHAEFGEKVREVYFPINLSQVGAGRPIQPVLHLEELLHKHVIPMAVLINPLVIPVPTEHIRRQIIDELTRLYELYGIEAATLSDLRLAQMVRRKLPALRLTASCLFDVTEPGQVKALGNVFNVLVPSTRMTRRPDRLALIRSAFRGRIRLLVNEACLDSCLDRKQHFYEMAHSEVVPESLCSDQLRREPWLRLTGAWILPQHVDQIDPLVDEFKLAGRITLRKPEHYKYVLRAYLSRSALWPDEIGGGPASVLSHVSVPLAYFQWMLHCDHACGNCFICQRIAASQDGPEVTA
jgi:collagenase-like PrtC family protease